MAKLLKALALGLVLFSCLFAAGCGDDDSGDDDDATGMLDGGD